jgi:threonine aldolase
MGPDTPRFTPPRPDPSLPPVTVNLYSDTQTKPTPAMRAAMLEAEVGDEQSGLDPTINLLCDRMAALLGKAAAMFLPTGTMCNEVAILTHCRPGDDILAHASAHIAGAEGGAPWALAGVRVNPLPGDLGLFSADTLRDAIYPRGRYTPPATLVSVEQTANLGGGTIWSLDHLAEVAGIAHEHGMATHMDGARLLNAAVAAGQSAADMAAHYDSVWLDFTKGLGAPLGAVLAGSAAFIDQAWRWKQRMGGALRQGGICAAGCLYALDHHVARLADDHANARRLAAGIAQIPGLSAAAPPTNLVFIDTAGLGITANEFASRLRQCGVSVSVMGRTIARACLHLDVSAPDVDQALAAMRQVASH